MVEPRTDTGEHNLGLSQAEAAARLRQHGPNELPRTQRRGLARIMLEVLREPMFVLLVAGALIYFALGHMRDAAVLAGSIFIVFSITIYQERKAERALEALRDLASPRALVIRDGREQRIAGRDVVVGDLMLLKEGDRVPADALLLDCSDFMVDESLLTGESVPVRKVPWDGVAQLGRAGGDDLPFVYSSTLIVQGQASAEVLATGLRTQVGQIGKALQSLETEAYPLQKQTGRVVRLLATLGLMLCAIVALLFGFTRSDWLGGLLAGITVAMSLLPEEFPVVLTIFLALGAWRIAKQRVLTRRVTAIETLGAATVLCVDKTGTLTMNRMAVKRLAAGGETFEAGPASRADLPERFHELLEYAILASEINPFDPMDKALKELGQRYLAATSHLHGDWSLVREYSLSAQLLAHSHGWRSAQGDSHQVAVKGAPEAIADLCHLPESEQAGLRASVQAMAVEGLRVLGVAKAAFAGDLWPAHQHDFDFEFLGLVGFVDPLRPTVASAVADCHAAGVRVVMITGDYAGTAQAIARQIGLAPVDEIITGPELEALNDAQLRERVARVRIFARVAPEQKLRIVNAFKANADIVAMTGDGVNDAPALKAAHIGIAMGGRGTDVAREAAALVLLDDDFASIVEAIKLGRRIYGNLQSSMRYILAVHVPIAGMALLPLLFGWPFMFFPVHVLFLEFVIDPACTTAFEGQPAPANSMRRPPRRADEPLFSRRMVRMSVLQGLAALAAVAAVYAIALGTGVSAPQARTLAFTTLVLTNLGLIFVNLSDSRSVAGSLAAENRALWWVVGGALLALALALSVPWARELFQFAPLTWSQVAGAIAAALLSLIGFELAKLAKGRAATI